MRCRAGHPGIRGSGCAADGERLMGEALQVHSPIARDSTADSARYSGQIGTPLEQVALEDRSLVARGQGRNGDGRARRRDQQVSRCRAAAPRRPAVSPEHRADRGAAAARAARRSPVARAFTRRLTRPKPGARPRWPGSLGASERRSASDAAPGAISATWRSGRETTLGRRARRGSPRGSSKPAERTFTAATTGNVIRSGARIGFMLLANTIKRRLLFVVTD